MSLIITTPPTRTITLTPQLRALADRHGKRKNDVANAAGRKADWEDDKGGSVLANHQDGVAGEIAHLLSIGLTYDGIVPLLTINNFKGADVGANTEVRSTKSTWNAGKVKDRDRDERIVVFYRQLDRFRFVQLGWLTVAEAKQYGERKDPHGRGKPAYFVPDEALHPMTTFPEDRA